SGVTEYAVSNSLNDYLCYQIRSDGCLTTVCEGDEQSSSWNSWAGKSFKTLDIKEYTEDFIFRSLLSRKPQDIEAGTYPVILSRFAVSTLLQYMMWLALSGKTFEEGTSAFSGKLNSQVFDPQFNLSDDPIVSTDFPQIFDAYGEEKKKLSVIEKGVLKNVSYNHYYANRFQKPSTASEVFGSGSGFTHLKLHAGKKSFQELIQETEKAILVTRFWYVNASNPRSLTFTGVTKDGTFLIENGKIAKPIRKLRFTESLLKAFSKVDAISKDAAWVPETSFYEGRYLFAYWCPAIKLSEFHFSS
ncbi:MAG: TldD/PmbA family protein, partial [Deltaproteobacteria bacterium]|nr:TldD/PmbA family protein [Deltaproteobacteria bacterium]